MASSADVIGDPAVDPTSTELLQTLKNELLIDLRIQSRLADLKRKLASAECRLPESLHFTECDVILGVVRARSVHKIGYGHNRDWSAA